jgi:hypothetical protein
MTLYECDVCHSEYTSPLAASFCCDPYDDRSDR